MTKFVLKFTQCILSWVLFIAKVFLCILLLQELSLIVDNDLHLIMKTHSLIPIRVSTRTMFKESMQRLYVLRPISTFSF